MAMYDPGYLTLARELCDRYGVHLIADEIVVGFGRTGTMFACEQAAIVPDFLCLSKGITGGYLPLSCVLTTDDVYRRVLRRRRRSRLPAFAFLHRQRARLSRGARRSTSSDDDVIAVNREKSAGIHSACSQKWLRIPGCAIFASIGMIWAFDVADTKPGFAARLHQAALAQGVFVRPVGNTVYVMPPYVTSASDMAMLIQALLDSLAHMASAR